MEPNAFKKSPNQNICSQILSRLARFLESGDKFAEVVTLVFAVLFNQPLQGYKRSLQGYKRSQRSCCACVHCFSVTLESLEKTL